MIVVDAHEDLAWNMLAFGRDYLQSVVQTRAQEVGSEAVRRNGETLIGLPEWVAGRVAVVFATLFNAPARVRMGEWETRCYADADEAQALYWEQLELYQRLVADHPDHLTLVRTRADLEEVLATWQPGAQVAPRVGLVILMEGADGVREPAELGKWLAGGVRIVGPAWSGTRYSGGTGEPGAFTEAGHRLLRAMEQAGAILDLSHLADEAVNEALEQYRGPLIASHSNARALLPSSPRPERHLSDHAIRRIAEREGVIGVVLFNAFLQDGWAQAKLPRGAVTLEDVVAHVDHICQLVGGAGHVGIGSDFDGGFGLSKVPLGLDSVAELPRIGEALATRGYSTAQIEGILGGNWLRFLHRALPQG